jgi:hypothetical protein
MAAKVADMNDSKITAITSGISARNDSDAKVDVMSKIEKPSAVRRAMRIISEQFIELKAISGSSEQQSCRILECKWPQSFRRDVCFTSRVPVDVG